MLVTFTTKTYPDITMFGDVATKLIRMMGHSGTVPSAIDAADVTDSLAQLQTALRSVSPDDDGASRTDDKDAAEQHPPVSLALRAYPLIELLQAAKAAGQGVSWR